jgi:hypothetical protein
MARFGRRDPSVECPLIGVKRPRGQVAGKVEFDPDMGRLFDHLVGAEKNGGWHVQAKHFCGLEIEHRLEAR